MNNKNNKVIVKIINYQYKLKFHLNSVKIIKIIKIIKMILIVLINLLIRKQEHKKNIN